MKGLTIADARAGAFPSQPTQGLGPTMHCHKRRMRLQAPQYRSGPQPSLPFLTLHGLRFTVYVLRFTHHVSRLQQPRIRCPSGSLFPGLYRLHSHEGCALVVKAEPPRGAHAEVDDALARPRILRARERPAIVDPHDDGAAVLEIRHLDEHERRLLHNPDAPTTVPLATLEGRFDRGAARTADGEVAYAQEAVNSDCRLPICDSGTTVPWLFQSKIANWKSKMPPNLNTAILTVSPPPHFRMKLSGIGSCSSGVRTTPCLTVPRQRNRRPARRRLPK